MPETDTNPPVDRLVEIRKTATELRDLQKQRTELEAQLDALSKSITNLDQVILPQQMLDVGMTTFALEDGTVFALRQIYNAKIPEGQESAAFEWLDQNNMSGVIKNIVTVSFGRDSEEAANQLVQQLSETGVEVVNKKTVHPATLKSLVTEQIKAGNLFPRDIFGVTEINKVTIKTK